MNTDTLIKISLGDILFNEVCKYLGLSLKDNTLTYNNGSTLEYYSLDTITLTEKICADNEIDNNDKFLIDSVIIFDDGCIEFHNEYDCDAINWCQFDLSTITMVINQLIQMNNGR